MKQKDKSLKIAEYLLTNYRGLFAIVFLLPISVVYNLYSLIQSKILLWLTSAPLRHDERVKEIQKQIVQWQQHGAKGHLCTDRSPWLAMSELVPQYKRERTKIKIGLFDILELDPTRKTVRVEPLVSMSQITAFLIPQGWTLPVVPELDNLTVGGLIMGFGIETSSHKYGLFQHICESFELVTAEGKLVKCSQHENADLFYSVPWSYGTLGFLVAAELRLIAAPKYVQLHYTPVHSLDTIVSVFENKARDTATNDFVECLVYDMDKAVVITGNFANTLPPGSKLNSIGRWYKPWFYTHIETYLTSGQTGIEYIPLRQYYHRHTRSLFWEMRDIIPSGNSLLFRLLLGWALPPRISLLKYFETSTTKALREKHHLVQDMLMPIGKLKQSIQYFDSNCKIYPLWLCPMAIPENDRKIGFIHPFTTNGTTDELFVDIGAYGIGTAPNFDGNTALHDLEQFVLRNNGYQALYAKTLLSPSALRTMFDYSDYDRLRASLPYCKEAFGEVYDKVGGKARIAPSDFRTKQKVQ